MLTTIQVRAIMRKHGFGGTLYTNKSAGHEGRERRVKMYGHGTAALQKELAQAGGADTLTFTFNMGYNETDGLTVRCLLPENTQVRVSTARRRDLQRRHLTAALHGLYPVKVHLENALGKDKYKVNELIRQLKKDISDIK